MKAGNAHLQPKPKNQVFAASSKPAALGVQQGPYPHPQHFYQIPFIIGQYLFILWGGGRYFSCTYVSAQKTNWMQTFQLRVRRLNRKNTHCLESQAECSKAKSGQPTFSLNKSTCFLNCDMASNGADAWKLRRQICEMINTDWSMLFHCQDNSKVFVIYVKGGK